MENASPGGFRVIGYNLSNKPITATMRGQNVVNGEWTIMEGGASSIRPLAFGRDTDVPVVFPPHRQVEINFKLQKEGSPVSARPDIGIGPDDVHVGQGGIDITLHSLGAAPTPAGTLTLQTAAGKPVVSVPVPSLDAPLDLKPRTATVHINLSNVAPKGARLVVSLGGNPAEITTRNNSLTVP